MDGIGLRGSSVSVVGHAVYPANPGESTPSGPKTVAPITAIPASLPPSSFNGTSERAQQLCVAAKTKANVPLSAADAALQDALAKASPRERALHLVLEGAIKQAEARKAGVDLAKSNFFIKLMTFAGIAVSFGVTLALTVATAGAAAPMLALTSVRLVTAIGDVYYAGKCVKAAQESLKTGRPVPAPPLGGSCVGNWLYDYRIRRGDTPVEAKDYATGRSAIFTIALSLAMLATGTLWTPAVAGAAQISRWVSSILMGLMLPYELKVGFRDAQMQSKRVEATAEMLEEARSTAMKPEDLEWFQEVLADALKGVQGEQPLARKELEDLRHATPESWATQSVNPADVEARKKREQAYEAWRSTTRLFIGLNTASSFGRAAFSVGVKLA